MNFKNISRGLVLVAHPDDETLFAGGLILRYPGRWTVICCSIPRTDPIRAWKFYDACASLGVFRMGVLPFIESAPDQPLGNLDAVDLSGFDCVVTHNENGEYGHFQHRQLNSWVRGNADYRGTIVTFGYRPGGCGEIRLALTDEEQRRKRNALQCYDHVSPSDGKPKWQALIERYGSTIGFDVETFDIARA